MSSDYFDAFDEGRDLTEESAGFPKTYFRSDVASRVVQTIGRGRSVLLVGAGGVGKTRVVHEVASQMRRTGRAKVFEFSVSQLLTGTKYLGEWETKANRIIGAAMESGTVLYFSDIWNLPSAAKASNRDVTAWDLMRPFVEQERLQLIGEMSPDQLLGMSKVTRFAALFESIVVEPLSDEQIFDIASAEAPRLNLKAERDTIRRALELCRQFLPVSEGPGPVLELLAQIRDYQLEKIAVDEPESLSPRFVEKVFSIYTGLPQIVISPSVTQPVSEIIDWFEGHIVGQKDAIHAVVEAIALYKAGLHDPGRPIGSFLFVGPTGVGKTELARALARFLFGSEDRLLRFDLSEYKDYHAFQLLIGEPGNPTRPARLVDPVRARPFQVVLLDEIEKAHANVWDLLLQLLDEGRLTPGIGKPVSFRNTIVIATSNVGATEQAKASPGFHSGDADAAGERMRHALEAAFRPELLNRFQHICLFHPLSVENVRQIAQMELRRVLNRQGIAGRSIVIDVTPQVLELVIEQGHDAHYGARALKRMIQRHVTVPIATLLLERSVEDGSLLRLVARQGSVKVEVIDTAETRIRKAESQPIRSRLGPVSSRGDIENLLQELERSRTEIAEEFAALRRSPLEADEALDGTAAWRDPEALARLARQREISVATRRRLDRLHQEQLEFEHWLERAVTREERERLVTAIVRHEHDLRAVRRELILMPDLAVSDALLELRPLGAKNNQALELFRVYSAWAKHRGYSVDMVREPLSADETIVAAIGGHYAYGYLNLEQGHHRFRGERRNSVVHVRVFPWTDESGQPRFTAQRALKKDGLLGGRVRSRLVVEGSDLIFQNEKTLVENRAFAAGIIPSYRQDAGSEDKEVRRYDSNPFLLKDHLTGTSGRTDALSPDSFHNLLCSRIEAYYGAP